MKAAGILTYGTSLVDTDFSKLADAVGILGLRAERPGAGEADAEAGHRTQRSSISGRSREPPGVT